MATTRQGRRDNGGWLPWAILGGALLVGVAVAAGFIGSTVSNSTSLASCNVTPVANQVIPSMVTINVRAGNKSGTGSGEVIRSDGYILTNNHVVAAAADGGSVEVQFSDGQTAPAKITGRDPQTDLAVIKVAAEHPLTVIPLGSSSSVQVGQPVVVVGSPLGLSETVTSGIVSALDRSVRVPGENDATALLVSAVQTDAAINPGNSGGSMVNCDGQLIGIPSAGATVPTSTGEPASGGSIGLGFAIPVDLAKSISDEIIATGTVTHAYFGLVVVPIPDSAASAAGVQNGLLVQAVVVGGPSAKAGLRPGDVITTLDGQPAQTVTQLEELTLTKRPGETVEIGYTRNGQQATATVTLGAQP
jgi:putative serine protease PepD